MLTKTSFPSIVAEQLEGSGEASSAARPLPIIPPLRRSAVSQGPVAACSKPEKGEVAKPLAAGMRRPRGGGARRPGLKSRGRVMVQAAAAQQLPKPVAKAADQVVKAAQHAGSVPIHAFKTDQNVPGVLSPVRRGALF